MSLNLNKVMVAGRLTADPELKKTQSGISVISVTVAIDKPAKQGEEKKTEFIPVVAWQKTAEFISQYFNKGSSIFVEGYIQTRQYEKNGEKRYATEVVANEVKFVESKASSAPAPSPAASAPVYAPAAQNQGNWSPMTSDEDLPF